MGVVELSIRKRSGKGISGNTVGDPSGLKKIAGLLAMD